MEKYVGNLLSILDTIKILPHAFTLVGKRGSGKHTLLKELNQKFFDFDYLDITSSLSEDLITEIYLSPNKRLYAVDINQLSMQGQNILLKFLEEPSQNVYICLLTTNIYSLLPTVRNRCIPYIIEEYKIEDLKEFAKDNSINIEEQYFKVVNTPGEILRIKENNINLLEIDVITDKIVNDMRRASFVNMLSLVDKINFKDEYDKFDFFVLSKTLYLKYVDKYIATREIFYNVLADLLLIFLNTVSSNSKIDKKRYTTSLLISIWEINHGVKCS